MKVKDFAYIPVEEPVSQHELEKYTIYSDLHLFSPYSFDMEITFGPNTYYLGDIYDLRYVKAAKIEEAFNAVQNLRKKVGNHYIRGNHELNSFDDEGHFTIHKGILFTHGHLNICWSNQKAFRWERVLKSGKKLVGRELVSIEYFLWEKPDVPNGKYLDRAFRFAKEKKCHTIVFGHTHVKKLFDKTFIDEQNNQIRIINVPRGKTILKL